MKLSGRFSHGCAGRCAGINRRAHDFSCSTLLNDRRCITIRPGRPCRAAIIARARRAGRTPITAGPRPALLPGRAGTLPVTAGPGAARLLVAIAVGPTVAGGLVTIPPRRRAITTAIIFRAVQTIAGSHADFKFDDLIPLLITAIAFGDGQQVAQTATWIRGGGNFTHTRIMTHLAARK